MSTASFDLATSIPSRIHELIILTEKAKDVQDKEEALYNALCRACCVLLASHLEGFLKELSSAVIADLNFHLGDFSRMPAAMQRAFCHKIAFYEGVPTPDIESRTKQLLTFFTSNSVAIDLRAITYKENVNKNPSTNVIERKLQLLGAPSALSSIATPAFEVVFDNNDRTNYRLVRNLRRFTSNLYHFPFRILPAPYTPLWRRSKGTKDSETLWHAFVEEVMTRRHTIAHGDTLANDTSWEELRRDAEKLRVLMYGLLLAVAPYLVPQSREPKG